MKKNSLNILIVLVTAFILSACGTNAKTDPVSESKFSFFNATTPLLITEPTDFVETNTTTGESNLTRYGETYIIAVQLLKYGFPESGEIVQMMPFDINLGFITNMTTLTDSNGYAVFEYTVPYPYDTLKGTEAMIQAIYSDTEDSNSSSDSAPKITLTQDFVLVFQ